MPLKSNDISHSCEDDLERTLARIGENLAMLAGALDELKRQIDRGDGSCRERAVQAAVTFSVAPPPVPLDPGPHAESQGGEPRHNAAPLTLADYSASGAIRPSPAP